MIVRNPLRQTSSLGKPREVPAKNERISYGRSLGHAMGFTLIEVVAAFFLTTVVLFFVTGIFSENAKQRSAAAELLRVETTASAALDLIAQDLEGTVFVTRPLGSDPRSHSWRFLGEGSGELGASFVRFQTQNVPRGNLGENASTWVDIAYFVTEEEVDEYSETEGPSYTLWRWRSSRPPSEAAQRNPDPDDPGSARVAEGLAAFGIRFVDPEGGVVDDWDSAFAPDDAPIPMGVEISLMLHRLAREGETDSGALLIPGRLHERVVTLAMHRPINLDVLISLALSSDGDPNCGTIADCADFGDEWFVDLRKSECDGDEELCSLLNASAETCWSAVEKDWPSIANEAAAECEDLL